MTPFEIHPIVASVFCALLCWYISSVCLVCSVFVNCLVKQFAMCLGVVAILLLNVMDSILIIIIKIKIHTLYFEQFTLPKNT